MDTHPGSRPARALVRCVALLLVGAMLLLPGAVRPASAADNSAPPAAPVKLVFAHHSVGQNWLDDEQGGLGTALAANNYFVSDTNYGWGPDAIGDRTDIPNWPEWFVGPQAATYTSALYALNDQNSPYTRTGADPGGPNQVIMFKSCFPNSSLAGRPDDPPSPGYELTVGNAKWVYNQLLSYFGAHPEKLFVVVTAPPNSESGYAANARAFNTWLLDSWRTENHYSLANVAVFDFYNVLTGPDNHHRLVGGVETHPVTAGMNGAYYRTAADDDHPNAAGSRKATAEFVPLLNAFYHRWQASLVGPSALVPMTPVRVADSRVGSTAPQPALKTPLVAGATLEVPIAGRNGVPLSAGAVSLNITSVGALGAGHLRVYPCGGDLPATSSLNYPGATNVANAVVMGLGAGAVCLYTSATTDVVVDLNGWMGDGFSSMAPRRAADTRATSPVRTGEVLTVPVAGHFGVPGSAVAVVLNVTAVRPVGAGHLRVFPCGASVPTASTLNFLGGAVVANAVLSGVGAGGAICVYAGTTADVIVDVDGWFSDGFVPVAPVRVADTRSSSPVAYPQPKAQVGAGQTLQVPIAGAFGVPSGARAVAVNVTATGAAGAGHLRVFPCGSALPGASSLNFPGATNVANAVLTGLGSGGAVCVYAATATDVVVDVTGWFPAAA